MALDDFAPLGSTPTPAETPLHHSAPEDEDLFDFPVVEMKLETDAEPTPPAAALRELGVPVVPAAPAPTAPTAARAPAAAPAPAPVTPSKPPAAKAPAADTKPKSAAPGKQEQADVRNAARLVEDLEQVLGDDARPRKRKFAFSGAPATTLVGLGLLLVANVGGLLFLWNMSQSFQSSVKAMNEEFVRTVHTLNSERPAQTGRGGANTSGKAEPAPVALEAFEKTALSLAREEIANADYGAARHRLARLLAVADRIEPEEREEIEAQAAFLFAGTYRLQAEAARERHP